MMTLEKEYKVTQEGPAINERERDAKRKSIPSNNIKKTVERVYSGVVHLANGDVLYRESE